MLWHSLSSLMPFAHVPRKQHGFGVSVVTYWTLSRQCFFGCSTTTHRLEALRWESDYIIRIVPGHIFWFIGVDDRGILNCFRMAKLYQLCVRQTEKHTNYDPLSQSLSPPSRLFRSFQACSGGMPEGFWMPDAINDDVSIYNDVNCLFVCIEFIWIYSICHVCLQVYTACHLDTVHGWSDHISLIYKFMAIRDGTHHGSCFKKPISYFLRSWFWQRCRNSCPSENIPLSLYVLFI